MHAKQLEMDLSGHPARHNVEEVVSWSFTNGGDTVSTASNAGGCEQYELVTGAVDYLTLTTTKCRDTASLEPTYSVLANGLHERGHTERAWNFQGYSGGAIGSLAYGTREDGACLRASGHLAHLVFLRTMGLGVNVTRLDLQLTFTRKGPRNEALCDARASATARAKRNKAGRAWAIRFIDGHGDGNSTYFGSRSSRIYGRTYDKTAESKGDYPPNSWRRELELKREVAYATHAILERSASLEQTIAELVVGQYASWGISLPLAITTATRPPTYRPELTTLEQKLNWLQRQVRPTVQQLMAASYTTEVVERLFHVEQFDDGAPLDANELDALQYELRNISVS